MNCEPETKFRAKIQALGGTCVKLEESNEFQADFLITIDGHKAIAEIKTIEDFPIQSINEFINRIHKRLDSGEAFKQLRNSRIILEKEHGLLPCILYVYLPHIDVIKFILDSNPDLKLSAACRPELIDSCTREAVYPVVAQSILYGQLRKQIWHQNLLFTSGNVINNEISKITFYKDINNLIRKSLDRNHLSALIVEFKRPQTAIVVLNVQAEHKLPCEMHKLGEHVVSDNSVEEQLQSSLEFKL